MENHNFTVISGQRIGKLTFDITEYDYKNNILFQDKSKHADVLPYFDSEGIMFGIYSSDTRLIIPEYGVKIGEEASNLPEKNRLSKTENLYSMKFFVDSYCYDGICFIIKDGNIDSVSLFKKSDDKKSH